MEFVWPMKKIGHLYPRLVYSVIAFMATDLNAPEAKAGLPERRDD
jgi:hypothetical protein